MVRSEQPITLRIMSNQVDFKPVEVGIFSPGMKPIPELEAGDVGYIATGLKTVKECRVGDTITNAALPATATFGRLQAPQTDGFFRNLSG